MKSINTSFFTISVEDEMEEFVTILSTFIIEDRVEYVRLNLTAKEPIIPSKMALAWSLPTSNVHAQWNPMLGFNRGLTPDWGSGWPSKSTSGAPIHCLYNYAGENVLTFAANDALNPLKIYCGVNEETAVFKCRVEFFIESMSPITEYELILRLDTRKARYNKSINDVSNWWKSFSNYNPAAVPGAAKFPIYSTWYNFHQLIDPIKIKQDCILAKELGCESVIVDDGWQTENNNRGYAYCGDWEVAKQKIPDMKSFVDSIHDIDMKFILWFSVPYVGIKSKVWHKFKGKFLRSQKDWCVLDPRFPEVREYLINIYETAAREWNVDGLKLDFVDSFYIYDQSKNVFESGMDYESVSQAVDKLLKDIIKCLNAIKTDFIIEFRQSYIGPLMRTYGNMFRAGDCPNDSLGNRLRTIDIRLLSGNTAVHSDMIMWNYNEPVESAAMQIINILFSVPQISVIINQLPDKHFNMLKYWLKFWISHRDVLLDGKLIPLHPEANYSCVLALNEKKLIAVAYSSTLIHIPEVSFREIILINGSYEDQLLVQTETTQNISSYEVHDCCGNLIDVVSADLAERLTIIQVPPAGIVIFN